MRLWLQKSASIQPRTDHLTRLPQFLGAKMTYKYKNEMSNVEEMNEFPRSFVRSLAFLPTSDTRVMSSHVGAGDGAHVGWGEYVNFWAVSKAGLRSPSL